MYLSFQYHQKLEGEEVPDGVTHVIVDDSVTIIKEMTFYAWTCDHIVSVIMGDTNKLLRTKPFLWTQPKWIKAT